MVGGVDYEGELAAARLRLAHRPDTAAEAERRRREEGEEQFDGRLLALALVGVAYVLFALFG